MPHFPSDLRDPGRVRGHGAYLTRMSGLRRFAAAGFGGKPSRSLGMARLARCVHRFALVMAIVVGAPVLAGCPPPPLSLDEPDARPNSAPAITSVRGETGDELTIGGENIVPTNSSLTITLVDTDVDDTLYVRGFRDYGPDNLSSALVVCNVGPSTPRAAERTLSCILSLGYCTAPGDPRMDIVVSDRLPDDSGANERTPYYTVAPPGLQAVRVYQITCQEPT